MIHDLSHLASDLRAAQVGANSDVYQEERKRYRLTSTTVKNYRSGALQLHTSQVSKYLSSSARERDGLTSTSTHPFLLIRASRPGRKNATCAASCRCKCHIPHSFQFPPFWNRLLGKLFVGYSGCPAGLVPPCNQGSCHAGLSSTTQVNYIFPPWFCNKLIKLSLETSLMGDANLNLVFYRGVPTGSKIFQCTALEDVDSLRSLIVGGLASPKDVDNQYGYTALQVSSSQSDYYFL